MVIRTRSMRLAGTVLLVHCIYSGQAGAYNPNDDPNAVNRSRNSPVKSELVFALAGDFERLAPGHGIRRHEAPGFHAPQPAAYTRADLPPAPSHPLPYAGGPIDPLVWGGYPFWNPASTHSSPRIPWRRLLRFTERSR